jgi:hypothetical protein
MGSAFSTAAKIEAYHRASKRAGFTDGTSTKRAQRPSARQRGSSEVVRRHPVQLLGDDLFLKVLEAPAVAGRSLTIGMVLARVSGSTSSRTPVSPPEPTSRRRAANQPELRAVRRFVVPRKRRIHHENGYLATGCYFHSGSAQPFEHAT